ncbi:NUDIX hydrolase [Luteimicrobium subarcticum]|uniref:ADP-ribose pyrophosphatase YjhB (NUDIX family) n=1 Tax=Luteimicrobium subarcticum TaxID=620910 RepID=A0A2M8WW80_9MICO|nr:NUDIX domain-containing protein [Luteimicrobium subarcticum]PJI95177.1 ADP-ribose pyrophosphatase YjhB (NUDIX family) [Luteimicrobium subarcticum]
MPIPPFVLDLRSHVGHAPLWLPGVSAVVRDDAGRLLLGRRADTGRWAVVSGILDPGEEPAVGAAREVLEETGLRVVVDGLAALSVTGPVHYPNGDVTDYLDLLFVCRLADGVAPEDAHVGDDESLDVAWFPPDALPDDLTESSVERLAWATTFLADPAAEPRFVRP